MTKDKTYVDFITWWRASEELLARRALRLSGNPQDAEDLLQTVAVRLWQWHRKSRIPQHESQRPSVRPFRDADHFRAVAFVALGHAAIDRFRRRAAQDRTAVHTENPTPITRPAGDILDALARAIGQLPSRQQEVARRYFLEGTNASEIADGLGKKRATVRSLLRYARQNLETRLRNEDML
jgi:RNA polymerase sigma factor (sigma-70 family)